MGLLSVDDRAFCQVASPSSRSIPPRRINATHTLDCFCFLFSGVPHDAIEDAQAMDPPVLRPGQRLPVPLREEEPRRHQEAEGMRVVMPTWSR